MKRIVKYFAMMAAIGFLAASCDKIKDDLTKNCDEGAVNVQVYVERFGSDYTGPIFATRAVTENSEAAFNTRIEKASYYLYRNNVLIEQGTIENPTQITSPYWVFTRESLEPGNYKLGLLANCTDDVLGGTPDTPGEFTIEYPGYETAKDYFINMFEFRVSDSKAVSNYTTQLKRVHGVVRITFNDLKEEIKAIGISIKGLTSSSCIMGNYSKDYIYSRIIPINGGGSMSTTRAAAYEPTIAAMFPTMDGGFSDWNIVLYGENDEVLAAERMVADNFQVVRNRLLDLSASFNGDELVIGVELDPEWDGSIDGGIGTID